MDRWNSRRSRPTSSFTQRSITHRPSSPDFEQARFKRSSNRFESYDKRIESPVRNKSGYRDRSRSPLSDHDRFRERSDSERPFRGGSDRGRPFRGRSDRGRPFRGMSDRGRPFRGTSDRGRPFRGTSDRGRTFRGVSERGRSFRGRPDGGISEREEPFRGKSYGGKPFRGMSDQRESFRGVSDGRRPFRGTSNRGESFRGRTDDRKAFKVMSDREEPFRESLFTEKHLRDSPDGERYLRARSHSRESYQSFQEKSRNRPMSRSTSRDRHYAMKPEKERYIGEEYIRTKVIVRRSRSNSRDRLYFKESLDQERYSDKGSLERFNDRPRISRSRSNSRSRLYPIIGSREPREFVDIQHNTGFESRKSRSRSNSRDRLHSTGHKVNYDQSFEIKNDYQLRKSKSRSNSRDRQRLTYSINNDRFIDEEYQSQSNYKPREFRSISISRERLSPSDRVGFDRDDLHLENPSGLQLRESRIPDYNYLSSQKELSREEIFKEKPIYSHSRTDMGYTNREDLNRVVSYERKSLDDDRLFNSKPKVYRLSTNFGSDFNEGSSQFQSYPTTQLSKRESELERDFPPSFININSPPYPKIAFENKEFYERKFHDEHTRSTNFENQNRFISHNSGGFKVDDEFHMNQKRSFQDAFSPNDRFEEGGSSQHTYRQQDQFKKNLFVPKKFKKFGISPPIFKNKTWIRKDIQSNNGDKPKFQNKTWHRENVKKTVPQEDLRELSQVIIFFDFNATSISRNLWIVLFNSLKRCNLWLNCIENCYQANYQNIFYCILKWKSRDIAREEDVEPVVAKQKACFTFINQLAQTNYTIKARPEYFCCSLETLKQKYEPLGACRFIKLEEARGVVAGFKLIEELLEIDNNVELIFGGEEHKPIYLDGVKKFAMNKENMKFRFLSEDHISVSLKLTPEYIKKDLLEDGLLSDKYELIPPLGPGKNLLHDHNLSGFLPLSTKFFTGVHITKIKKCKNFVGKLKKLEKRTTFEKASQLVKDGEDPELAKLLIDTLPKKKKRRLTNKLLRSTAESKA